MQAYISLVKIESVFGKQILYKSMTFFCIPFIVLYLLSHVKIVVCICMYSILNKILFTLRSNPLLIFVISHDGTFL